MRISSLLFVLVVANVTFSCKVTHKQGDALNAAAISPADSLLFNERLRLKKYALCKCLEYKYPGDSTFIRDGSLEGFMQTSSYGSHAFEAIDSFIEVKSSAIYKSKNKKNLYLMKCLDIYEDKELELLIKKLDDETSVGK